MRKLFAIIYLFVGMHVVTGADPVDDDALQWRPAFSAISATKTDQTLVVMLITNDDAFKAINVDPEGAESATQWCGPVFEQTFRKASQLRADLKENCVLQYVVAGTPSVLTGGSGRNQPARAIVAVCDGTYHLLSFVVGVPDTDEFLTLIEDAQDTRAMINLSNSDEAKVASSIAERSTKRITRLWRGALKEMLATMDVGNQQEPDQQADLDAQRNARLGRIADSYDEVYMADVKLRFGLTEAADRTRLIILEQHPEARRPWCESILPFVAGSDFVKTWLPLTESIWHVQPIVHSADAEDLLAWWDAQFETQSFTLAIQPPLLMRQQPWPPVSVGSVAEKRGLGWQGLQDLLLKLPFRNIDAQQLAILMRERELSAIDIQRPTRTRYLFFEPKKKTAWSIREGDIPGKHIGRIKRTIKN